MTMPATAPNRGQVEKVFSPDKFIDALRDADMTPAELSKEMDASQAAIARWMGGLASPKPAYAKLAAAILDIDVDEFYE